MKIKADLSTIRRKLLKFARAETKRNYEKYFKGVLTFHGLRSPQVQAIFRKLWPDLKELQPEERKTLAFQLIASSFAEEKQFGILILHNTVKEFAAEQFIHELAELIDQHVYDWATSDGLSGRVIRFLIPQSSNVVQTLVSWKDTPNIWRKRSAAVSFVHHARHGKYTDEIITICDTIVKDPERFVQLGTGWVLRELSLADKKLVLDFIAAHSKYFSKEGIRYALEKVKK